MTDPQQVRLQKYLADRGVASRRAAELMIQEGRVRVNGAVVTELGRKVAPLRDKVAVDNDQVGRAERLRYLLLYKPGGYICSAHDERGRRTVLELLPEIKERIYPVGRLDYDTSGLLLLTNDGALTQHLLHPSHQVDKAYRAEVDGCPGPGALRCLAQGVRLSDGLTAPAQARLVRKNAGSAVVEITIHEGRNRQVRRMLDAVGHPARWLKRTRLAFLELGELRPGQYRELSAAEIRRLKEL